VGRHLFALDGRLCEPSGGGSGGRWRRCARMTRGDHREAAARDRRWPRSARRHLPAPPRSTDKNAPRYTPRLVPAHPRPAPRDATQKNGRCIALTLARRLTAAIPPPALPAPLPTATPPPPPPGAELLLPPSRCASSARDPPIGSPRRVHSAFSSYMRSFESCQCPGAKRERASPPPPPPLGSTESGTAAAAIIIASDDASVLLCTPLPPPPPPPPPPTFRARALLLSRRCRSVDAMCSTSCAARRSDSAWVRNGHTRSETIKTRSKTVKAMPWGRGGVA
jgi:hypothetical protein